MCEFLLYTNPNQKEPFTEWLKTLDQKTKNRVFNRILRIQSGNLGDYKSVGDGVFELILFFDGGLSVYFGRDENKIIVLLCGGDKSAQRQDIKTAKKYWSLYQNA